MNDFKLSRGFSEPRGTGAQDAESNAAIAARASSVAHDLSCNVVARLVGSDPESTRRYLRGLSRMPASFAAGFCRATGVSPAWLLLGTGDKWAPPAPSGPGSDLAVRIVRGS